MSWVGRRVPLGGWLDIVRQEMRLRIRERCFGLQLLLNVCGALMIESFVLSNAEVATPLFVVMPMQAFVH